MKPKQNPAPSVCADVLYPLRFMSRFLSVRLLPPSPRPFLAPLRFLFFACRPSSRAPALRPPPSRPYHVAVVRSFPLPCGPLPSRQKSLASPRQIRYTILCSAGSGADRQRHKCPAGLPSPLRCLRNKTKYPGVAQLVARVVWDHQAAGSNPVTRTKIVSMGFEKSSCRNDFYFMAVFLVMQSMIQLEYESDFLGGKPE